MRLAAITQVCPQCGKPFSTTASRKEYCSKSCAAAHEKESSKRNAKAKSVVTSKLSLKQAESSKDLLSISAAARYLGVSRPTIYKYIEEGKLSPIRKSDLVIRIPISQLQQSEDKTQQLPSVDTTGYMTKSEVLRKYEITETWFHRRNKAKGVKSVRVGAQSYYEAAVMHKLFHKEEYNEITEWYTSEELAIREDVGRKYLCALARQMGIPTKRAGSKYYIAKKEWDERKESPQELEKKYMLAAQAMKHYHVGHETFYKIIQEKEPKRVRKGNYFYYLIKDLDRIFKNREPEIPDYIRKDYIRSCDALKLYHVGQKRFTDETKAANVTKVRTEGNFVWYRKEELDKLFK